MNFRKAILSSTIAIAWLAGASALDAARANDADNPYLPKPAASTEGSYGPYCSIRPLGPIWTCAIEGYLSKNGGGERRVSITPEVKITKPVKPPCEPKGEGPGPSTTGTGEGGVAGKSKA